MSGLPGREAPRVTHAQALGRLLARQIHAGMFRPGDRLPSIRDLSQIHGRAPNTVVAALEHLVATGLLEPRRGAGFFVRPQAARELPPTQGTAPRALDTGWLMRQHFGHEAGRHSLASGLPPAAWLEAFPVQHFERKAARMQERSLHGYGDPAGFEPLRRQLAVRLAGMDIPADPRHLVTFHGANDAMDMVIRLFVSPGAVVLVDEPGYYPLYGKLSLARARMLAVPRHGDGPDLALLARVLPGSGARLYFTQSCAHNPTGSDLSPTKARRLLQLAAQHDLTVVELDPFADFVPPAQTRISALDQLRRTIYIGSFSKSVSPALRVGFTACKLPLAEELARLKAMTAINTPEYPERLLALALADASYRRRVASLRALTRAASLRGRQRLEPLGASVFAPSASSLYAWTSFPGIADTLVLARQLQALGVASAPGCFFHPDPTVVSRWMRLNVAAVAESPQLVRQLAVVLAHCTAPR